MVVFVIVGALKSKKNQLISARSIFTVDINCSCQFEHEIIPEIVEISGLICRSSTRSGTGELVSSENYFKQNFKSVINFFLRPGQCILLHQSTQNWALNNILKNYRN